MSRTADTDVGMYRIPEIFLQFPGLIAAESTRHGGVSPAPFHSLNLGGSTSDSTENVKINNNRFFEALGVKPEQIAKSHQVHGCEILKVTAGGRFEGYDALITNEKNIQLAVTIADCTPVLVYDPVNHAVAAIHAGWRGTAHNIVSKTVKALTMEYGSDPRNCFAYVGTCIDECSFEVGEEVAVNFESQHKRWDPSLKKFFINLKLANTDQLLLAGLVSDHICISAYSSVLNNEDYFSYRHEKGLTGRMLATIGMKA